MILQDIDLVIGKCLESDGSFHGHVYDLRVWCLARTVAEVAAGRKVLQHDVQRSSFHKQLFLVVPCIYC